MQQIPKFKCRASMVGKIMTEPKEKSNLDKYNDAVEKLSSLNKRYNEFKNKECKSALEIINNSIPATKNIIEGLEKVKDIKQLSEGCKTYLKEWIISKKYGRKKEFTSKQTEKGDFTEQAGFDVIQKVLYPDVFLPKSKNYYEDDFKCGNPDVEILDTVLDNKSSYTIFTFPFGETELSNKDNIYQIHTYMDLIGCKKGKVCYTLNDTPFEIVDQELKSWAWRNKIEYDAIPESKAYEIIKNHIYTKEGLKIFNFILGTYDTSYFIEIPIEKRIVYFDFEYDEELIESINQRCIDCDNWVKENWDRF